jgi:hypothetical protein
MGTKDLTHAAIAKTLANDALLTHDQRAALLTMVADDAVWQRKHDEAAAEVMRLTEQVESLRAALQWYADGLHFDKASPDAWDTVSGEPQNWWCDEAGTATVEDGSIAAMTLRGELTAAQIQALD